METDPLENLWSDHTLLQPAAPAEAQIEAQRAEHPVQIHPHPDAQQPAAEAEHCQIAEAHPERPHGHDAHGHGKPGITGGAQDIG